MRRALHLLVVALLLAVGLGDASADDAGLGRDTSAASPGVLDAGSYTAELDPASGDAQDAYLHFAAPHAGVSVTLTVPPGDVARVSAGIEESDCWYVGAPPCVGDIAFDANGIARWSGGTLDGRVRIYVGAEGGPLAYQIAVGPYPMGDLVLPATDVLGEGATRTVRVHVENAGDAASPPATVRVRAEHVHGTLRSALSLQPVGIGSAREIGEAQLPALAPRTRATVDLAWSTTGELGTVELQSQLVDVRDAQWWNNARSDHVQAGAVPAPIPDPLNTVHSGRHLWGWTYAVGTRSPNGDPGVAADAYVDALILRLHAGGNTETGPYLVACGGRCETLV